MRYVFLLVFLIISAVTQAQTITGDRVVARQSLYLRDRWVDSIYNDTAFLNRVRAIPTADAVGRAIRALNQRFYDSLALVQLYSDTLTWDATRYWVEQKIGTDTASLSSRINQKLNLSDTAAMLANYRHWLQGYLKGTDTVSLSNRINLKLNISDTAAMLTNYRHWLAGYLKGSDTTSLSSRINLKQNISDTSTVDATRWWVQQQGYLNQIPGLDNVLTAGKKSNQAASLGQLNTKYLQSDTTNNTPYEIVVFPDIQNMIRLFQPYSRAMFKWVADSANYYNIKGLLQVGDVTDYNTTAEWDTVMNQLSLVTTAHPTLPYLFVAGNHDYGNGFNPAGRDATRFNTYLGPGHFTGKSFYGGNYNGSNENYWIKFEAGTKKYMALGLEFLPRDAVVTWASNLLDSMYAAEPDREVMVVTHAYISQIGELATDTSYYSGNTYGMAADNSGQELWDKLIRKKPNIRWVFSGHYIIPAAWAQRGLTERIVKVNDYGQIVNQIFVNYQDDQNWGDGYFMRLQFKPNEGLVNVKFWSPYFNQFDSRVASYSLSDPSITVTNSLGVQRDISVGRDVRIAGDLKVENLTPFRLVRSDSDHVIRDAVNLTYDYDGFKVKALKDSFALKLTLGDSAKWRTPYITGQRADGVRTFQLRSFEPTSLFMGDSSGASTVLPSAAGMTARNTGFGYMSLARITTGAINTAFGHLTLASSQTGNFNNAFGDYALATLTNGSDNVAIGQASMYGVATASNNTALGTNSMQFMSGNENTAIGKGALGNGATGSNNTAIGRSAGRDITGSDNVFIGRFAGFNAGAINNRLYIDNNGADGLPVLIYGEFDNQLLRINGQGNFTGKLLVNSSGTADSALQATGGVYATGGLRIGNPALGIPSGAKRLLMASDGTVYAADTTAGGTGSQTWQQSLVTGSTLTQNNTIAGGGYNWTWNNSGTHTINLDANKSFIINGGNSYFDASLNSGSVLIDNFVQANAASYFAQSQVNSSTTNAYAFAYAGSSIGNRSYGYEFSADSARFYANYPGSYNSSIALFDRIILRPHLGQLFVDTLAASTDTTTYKPMARGDNGQVVVFPSWPGGGTGSGVTTVGAFSGSSQTNGASISGSTITFGPADATNPGMVSTGNQTWAGGKTIRDSAFFATNSGAVAIGRGSTRSGYDLTIQQASTSDGGIMLTTDANADYGSVVRVINNSTVQNSIYIGGVHSSGGVGNRGLRMNFFNSGQVELSGQTEAGAVQSLALGRPVATWDFPLFIEGSTGNVIIKADIPTTGEKFQVNGSTKLDGSLVVNESGANADTRIEGDTDPNLFFTDASMDRVGIGTNAPGYKLDINGGLRASGTVLAASSTWDHAILGRTSFGTPFTGAGSDGQVVINVSGYTHTYALSVINGSSSVLGGIKQSGAVNAAGLMIGETFNTAGSGSLIGYNGSGNGVIVYQSTPLLLQPYGTNYSNQPVIIGNNPGSGDKLQVDGNLYVKGSAKFAGGTSGVITIAPQAAAGTYTMTLPNAQGGVGTYLKNDGSGNLSWDSPAGAGTVTSVATNTATGITGGTITGSGTLAIDTVLIATRAHVKHKIDSLGSAGGVSVGQLSDSLSNYWRKTGNALAAYGSVIGTTNDYDLRFITNNTERLRIDSSTGDATFTGDIIGRGAFTSGGDFGLRVGNAVIGKDDAGGSLQLRGATSSGVGFFAGGVAQGSIGGGSSRIDFHSHGNGYMFTYGGATTELIRMLPSFVYNESGADLDFRIEGDTDPNLIFVDASADEVRMGTTTDLGDAKLQVAGSIHASAVNPRLILEYPGNQFVNLFAGASVSLFSFKDKFGIQTATTTSDAGADNYAQMVFSSKNTIFGDMSFNQTDAFGSRVTILPAVADRKGLLVRGFTGQTANLAEFANSAGTALISVSSSGSLTMRDILAPGTPAADYAELYVRSDSLRFKNDGGIEFTLGIGGSGGVQSFSFTDGSGFDGTVTNSTTTPTLSLTTTVTNKALMYSNSGALAASMATQETNQVLVTGSDIATTAFRVNTPVETTADAIRVDYDGTKIFGVNPTGYMILAESAVPGTPATGYSSIYVKTDGKAYLKTDGGVEYDLTASGGGMADPGANGIVVRTALNTTTNRSVAGTTDRISVTNGDGVSGNPTVDIAATYAGQNTITTLGTIGTGTWQGAVIGSTYGGTGVNNGGRTLTISTNSGTLNFGAVGKTLQINNSITLAGTDATTMTFPSTNATIARTDAAQTFTGVQTLSSAPVLSSGTVTVSGNTITFPTTTSTLATLAGTETFTNKRVTRRVGTTASSATPTINTDNVDMYTLTAQTVDITSFTTNLSGTPTDGQTLTICITGTASRAITWGTSFEASSIALPTTTSGTSMLCCLFIWNPATSKWRLAGTW